MKFYEKRGYIYIFFHIHEETINEKSVRQCVRGSVTAVEFTEWRGKSALIRDVLFFFFLVSRIHEGRARRDGYSGVLDLPLD